MSGGNQEWQTPQWLFDILDAKLHFDIDVAASNMNKKCKFYLSEQRSAFDNPWFGLQSGPIVSRTTSAFCNPPFENPAPWIKLAHDEVRETPGSVAAMILNYDPSTEWYKEYAKRYASEIMVLIGAHNEKGTWNGGRVQFDSPDGNKKNGQSKPQIILVFRDDLVLRPCFKWDWDWHEEMQMRKEL